LILARFDDKRRATNRSDLLNLDGSDLARGRRPNRECVKKLFDADRVPLHLDSNRISFISDEPGQAEASGSCANERAEPDALNDAVQPN
jgi:hypothetical protein